jgi:coenzyme F420-reducing hydrogenase gamma subunit
MPATRPRLGVFKLASCDGCQLTLLDLEDELLDIADAMEIVHFPEMTSDSDAQGPFDLSLIEGSVSTPEQLELVQAVRERSGTLVTIGACATAGGIQALRNFADHDAFVAMVYARPQYIESLRTSTPVAEHVRVDFELRGCPIDKRQLREVISAALARRAPNIPDQSVCMQCKAAGYVCVVVARGEPCLGPVTHAGCGALCPGLSRGCYGCFGPYAGGDTRAMSNRLRVLGQDHDQIRRAFRFINNWAPAFREEGDRHE